MVPSREQGENMMITTNEQNAEVREVTTEELDAVAGGMLATMQFGNTAFLVWASAKDHAVIQVTAG
jgi:hypothetical protein